MYGKRLLIVQHTTVCLFMNTALTGMINQNVVSKCTYRSASCCVTIADASPASNLSTAAAAVVTYS
jgi:hypothetical protein